jgi:hypothetical protein
MDEIPLEIEGRAVAAFGFSHELRLFARPDTVETVVAEVHEVPEPVRMPQGTFRELETRRESHGLCGFEDVRKIVESHRSLL